MRHTTYSTTTCLSLTLSAILVAPVSAGLVFGPGARTDFENYRDTLGDTHIDFNSLPPNSGLDTQFSALGVTFASTRNINGSPMSPRMVSVISQGVGSNTIGGSVCNGFCWDGRVGYDINFAEPQRRAGLQRIWNTDTLTRFFNASGDMLVEHVNTANSEFVAFIADGNDPATDFVTRIEVDAIANRSVGMSDDLFFGTVIPEPASIVLLALGGVGLVARRRRRLQRQRPGVGSLD